jgi:hypothetical protein
MPNASVVRPDRETPGTLEVLDEQRPLSRITKDPGWMERWHDGSPSGREYLTPIPQDPEPSLAGQSPDGRPPKGNDDRTGICLDLVHESSPTGIDCLDRGLGRMRLAGHGVRDEEIALSKLSGVEGFPEHVARPPLEWASSDDLLRARRLADDDDPTRGIAARTDRRAEVAVGATGTVLGGRHDLSLYRPRE